MILTNWQDQRKRWHAYNNGSRVQEMDRCFGSMSRTIGYSADEVAISTQEMPNADGSKPYGRVNISFGADWVSGEFEESTTPHYMTLGSGLQPFWIDLAYDDAAKLSGIRVFSKTDGSDEKIYGTLTNVRDRLEFAVDFTDLPDPGYSFPIVIQLGTALFFNLRVTKVGSLTQCFDEIDTSDPTAGESNIPLYIKPTNLALFNELFSVETQIEALVNNAIATFKLAADKRYCSR